MSDYPRIVREQCLVAADWHRQYGDEAVVALVKETNDRAAVLATQIGITRKHVSSHWDLHVMCSFTEYPMYLVGDKAPQIKSYQDVFKHVWHLDNPVAEYIVTIRDQDEMDEDDKRWYGEMVEKAKELVARHGRREGLERFQQDGRWADNVMSRVCREMDGSEWVRPEVEIAPDHS